MFTNQERTKTLITHNKDSIYPPYYQQAEDSYFDRPGDGDQQSCNSRLPLHNNNRNVRYNITVYDARGVNLLVSLTVAVLGSLLTDKGFIVCNPTHQNLGNQLTICRYSARTHGILYILKLSTFHLLVEDVLLRLQHTPRHAVTPIQSRRGIFIHTF